MRSFRRERRGFVLIFALLVMPVFIGFAFIIIDIGRGNNAHADLSAAADAVALAGARELDGGPDAIDDAKAAMANITNSVSMLVSEGAEREIQITYADTTGNEFTVTFLEEIPVLDTDPIDQAWLTTYGTTVPEDAMYVHVRAQPRPLESVFFNPATMLNATVPVAATAVAKATSAVCDIPPLYICNPFEYDAAGNYVGDQLQSSFANGDLHGRLVRLHPAGNSTHTPGNFGYLAVNDPDVNSGARAIADFFAGARNGTCYEAGDVETKPGASNNVAAGINTRFDMYMAPYQNGGTSGPNAFTARTSRNVRKGIQPRVTGPNVADCVTQGGTIAPQAEVGDDHIWDPATGNFNANGTTDLAYGLPDNLTMLPPNTDGSVGMNAGVAGAYIGTGNWGIQEYLDRNYGVGVINPSSIPNTFPFDYLDAAGNPVTYSGPGFEGPSRYDVYQWEQANTPPYNYTYRTQGSSTGETGEAICTPGSVVPWDPSDPTTGPDPRVLVAAIVDCGTYSNNNGRTNFPVNSYANIFMARPMLSYAASSDMTIDVEIIDITGIGGNGNLETFVRDEAILVR